MYIGCRDVKPRLCPMTETPPNPVGYCRPPAHARFRKGRSGNPGGRPRRTTDLLALIEHTLDRPAPAATGQRGSRRSRREAIVAQLVEQAAAGELRATKLLLDLAEKARRVAAPAPVAPDEEDPREFLQRELTRLADAGAIPQPDTK